MSRAPILFIIVWVAIGVGAYNSFDPPYVQQSDPSIKEYHPATVVGKSTVDVCGDVDCFTHFSLRIKLSNSTERDVKVTQATYVYATEGSQISLERHISDPDVLAAFDKFLWVTSIWLCILWCAFGAFLIEKNHSKKLNNV